MNQQSFRSRLIMCLITAFALIAALPVAASAMDDGGSGSGGGGGCTKQDDGCAGGSGDGGGGTACTRMDDGGGSGSGGCPDDDADDDCFWNEEEQRMDEGGGSSDGWEDEDDDACDGLSMAEVKRAARRAMKRKFGKEEARGFRLHCRAVDEDNMRFRCYAKKKVESAASRQDEGSSGGESGESGPENENRPCFMMAKIKVWGVEDEFGEIEAKAKVSKMKKSEGCE